MSETQANGLGFIVKTEQWLELMRTFPSDGWDGAAQVIAAHDRKVCALERELDEIAPGWYDHLTTDCLRRTRRGT